MDLCTRMYRVRKTALEMLQDRGYVVTSVRSEIVKYKSEMVQDHLHRDSNGSL